MRGFRRMDWKHRLGRWALGLVGVAGLSMAGTANAQFLMMPDSTNDRVVLFDPFDGSVVNDNYFALVDGTTPFHAMQVGINDLAIRQTAAPGPPGERAACRKRLTRGCRRGVGVFSFSGVASLPLRAFSRSAGS